MKARRARWCNDGPRGGTILGAGVVQALDSWNAAAPARGVLSARCCDNLAGRQADDEISAGKTLVSNGASVCLVAP